MMRTSTFSDRVPPTGTKVPSWSTRRSFTCMAGLMSATSSRKKVPPSATLNRPGLSRVAPVKDPFTCPNSSDSSNWSLSAEQFWAMNCLSRRGPLKWSARAISSLPVPFSPWTRTVTSLATSLSSSPYSRRIGSLLPMMSAKRYRPSSSSCRSRMRCSRCATAAWYASISSTVVSIRSASRGTSRASIRWTVLNASSGSTIGSDSDRTVVTARARALAAFSSTRKPQAKSEPRRSPAKEMGVATISSPMWQGPSSSVPEERFCTAFSMLWLQRRRPSLSARQAVQIRFWGGMMMPLP